MHINQQKALFFSTDLTTTSIEAAAGLISMMRTTINAGTMMAMSMAAMLMVGRGATTLVAGNMSRREWRLVGAYANAATTSPLLDLAA